MKIMDKTVDLNTFPADFSIGCTGCQDFHSKYKHLCVTCKAPCLNCNSRSTSSISTDTFDFDKYLESLTRKPKCQLKVKTIGTDTCDLDSHFDYYKVEKTVVIQKSVATDCADLNFRKLLNRKKNKKHQDESPSKKLILDSCDFSCNSKCEAKTYSPCSAIVANPVEVLPKSEENKENREDIILERPREVVFQDSSSDESDVDLMTSSKVLKCRKVARAHNLTLIQIELDQEEVYKCSSCGKTFPKKYLGLIHLGDHVEDDRLKCLSCESNFTSVEQLTLHVKEAHRGLGDIGNILMEDDVVKTDKLPSDKGFKDKGFQCVLCSNANGSPVRFPSYKALYLHKRMKHGAKEMKHPERKPRLKREFICLFCGKEFKSNKALNDHLPVHTGEKNYLCDICNKSYTTSANLQIHKRTHAGSKNFKCTLCDKAFHKKDSLKVHFRKHSGERPFQCDLCPMKFDRNFILKNHRLRHFSEKTFICPVCGKAFTTHGGLNNHEKSHKRDSGSKKPRKPAVKPTLDTENAVICDVCGKVYSSRSNLRIHKFVHLGVKPFQCPVCQQSYAKKDSMLTHMRKHTDERPFSCETCGMAFYRNHTLKTHRLRHTGERPHKCHMCGKSFTQSSSLTYHIKHHNRKDEKKILPNGETVKNLRKKKSAKKSKDVKNDDVMSGLVVMNDDNDLENPQMMVPIVKKEVFVLDEKKNARATEIFEQDNSNKFNYYIAKNHILVPKDGLKTKVNYVKNEGNLKEEGGGKEDQIGENLIISKEKDDCLMMGTRELWSKKSDFEEIIENRNHGKQETVLPIAGEILNATFISDENGEVIPFGSMTLQSVNADNIMISPLIKVETADEGDRRRGLTRCSRLTVIDSKVKYAPAPAGKSVSKGNCQILNLKDSRMQQRIQLINSEPLSFHIQVPVSCTAVADEAVLNGIASAGTYYSNV